MQGQQSNVVGEGFFGNYFRFFDPADNINISALICAYFDFYSHA